MTSEERELSTALFLTCNEAMHVWHHDLMSNWPAVASICRIKHQKIKQRLTVSWIMNLGSASPTPARQYKPFMLLFSKCMQAGSYNNRNYVKQFPFPHISCTFSSCNVTGNDKIVLQLLLCWLAWISWPLLRWVFLHVIFKMSQYRPLWERIDYFILHQK